MPSDSKNLYKILQIEPDASQESVERAYRRMALLYHPDVNKGADANLRMQEVNEAFNTLRYPEKRAHYDREHSFNRFSNGSTLHPEHVPQPKTTTLHPDSPFEKKQPPAQPVEQLVTFYLSRQLFALTIQELETVVMMQSILPDASLPGFIEGIIQYRGSQIPILDLRKNLGFPLHPITRESRILLVNLERARLGLIVDSVDKFVNIPKSDIDYAPPINASSSNGSYIKGIAKLGPQLAIWLNLPFLLSQEDLAALTAFIA